MSIILKDIHLTYSPGTPFSADALRGINLEIKSNQIVAVIGHTGSGKSTLVQVMAGLQKPSSGEVPMDDFVLYKKKHGPQKVATKSGNGISIPGASIV